MLDKREFYINGQWVSPAQAHDLDVINPSTEEVCAVISLGDQADTDAAVATARAAFDGWSQTPKAERLTLLEKLSDIYEARSDEMGETISPGNGRTDCPWRKRHNPAQAAGISAISSVPSSALNLIGRWVIMPRMTAFFTNPSVYAV